MDQDACHLESPARGFSCPYRIDNLIPIARRGHVSTADSVRICNAARRLMRPRARERGLSSAPTPRHGATVQGHVPRHALFLLFVQGVRIVIGICQSHEKQQKSAIIHMRQRHRRWLRCARIRRADRK